MNPGSQKGIRLVMGGLGLCAIAALALGLIAFGLPPLTILAVTVAGIVLPILIMNPEAGMHLYLVMVFFENAGEANQTFTLGKMGGALIMGSWLLHVAVTRRLHVRINAMVLALLGFVGWTALSIMTAYNTDVATRQTLTYAQLVVLMLMVGSVIRTPEAVRRLLWTLVATTAFTAVHGLMQYALFGGQTTASVLGNRNQMATVHAFGIACAYLLYQLSRAAWERLALVAALPLLFVALALTFSRTGIICVAVVFVFVGYRLARHSGFFVLGATAAMLAIIAVSLPGAFYTRVESIGSTVRNQEDTFGMRVQLAGAGFRMIAEHPALGVGPGNYSDVLPRFGRSGYLLAGHWASHNTYVGIASESGIPAIALFLLGLGFAFRDLRAVVRIGYKKDLRVALLAIAVEVSVLALLVSGLSGNQEKVKFLYIFLGLVLSLDSISRKLEATADVAEGDEAPIRLAGGLEAAR